MNKPQDTRIFISKYDMLSLLFLLLHPKKEGYTSSDIAKAVYGKSPKNLNLADSNTRKRLKRFKKMGLVHRVSKYPCRYTIVENRVKYGKGPLIVAQGDGEGLGINLGRYITIIDIKGFVIIRPVSPVWKTT